MLLILQNLEADVEDSIEEFEEEFLQI